MKTKGLQIGSVRFDDWIISGNGSHGGICASRNLDVQLTFRLAHENGITDANLLYVYDIKTGRGYVARRYLRKYVPMMRDVVTELLRRNALWDCDNHCPAVIPISSLRVAGDGNEYGGYRDVLLG